MRILFISILTFIISLSLLSFSNKTSFISNIDAQNQYPLYTSYHSQWAQKIEKELSIEDKIGQLIMLPAYPSKDSSTWKALGDIIEKNNIGGIVIFKGTPYRTAKMINYLQSRAKIPLLVAIDGEWGISMRMDSVIDFPHQMQLGAISNNSIIYEFGVQVAIQCKKMGININFAPVIDINNNPYNPVINSRSFGENRKNVAEKGLAYMKALQDNKILAVAKHFPGHGNTIFDSHKTLPIIEASKKELDSLELYPFKYLIENKLGAIMSAHLNIPSLDSTPNLASSLSAQIIKTELKTNMGFKGIVFTDALDMQSVAKYYEAGELEVKAIMAGNDILLMPKDAELSINSIAKGIKNNIITEIQIEQSLKKILDLKFWLELNKYKKNELENITDKINGKKAELINRKLIENSITLLQDSLNIIPFKNLANLKIASVEIGLNKTNIFKTRLNKYIHIPTFYISKQYAKNQLSKINNQLKKFDYLIVSTQNTNQYSKNYGIEKNTWLAIEDLAKKHKIIFVNFANPYSLSEIKKPENFAVIIESYNNDELTQDYTAQVLFGGIKASGKLPVSVANFKEGTGISTTQNRLKYSIPLETKVKESYFKNIDSIVNDAIDQGAMPGCQVLAIKDGIVFFEKNYGYHTYKKKTPVTSENLYDLASLTKILASVPSLMYLRDKQGLNINSPLKKYLPRLDTTNKGNISIKKILAHQARLKAWIPFYLNTFDPYSRQLQNNLYKNQADSLYSTQVAKNIYILNTYKDTIYTRILNSNLRNRNAYRYSDLGFYIFKELIQTKTQMPLERFTDSCFYAPLGAFSVGYNPLEKFNAQNITPTENDINYRKQVLQGYVHDYGAAMLGGVGGHAGLFGNANDIAKIMQMYLNGGWYGDKKFIQKSSIDLFTTRPYKNNRRALGFDKPPVKGNRGAMGSLASKKSYGHTGFTGTIVWVDPKYNFIYIFLSNRIYPDIENEKLRKMNIRSKVHNEFYKAILTQ